MGGGRREGNVVIGDYGVPGESSFHRWRVVDI